MRFELSVRVTYGQPQAKAVSKRECRIANWPDLLIVGEIVELGVDADPLTHLKATARVEFGIAMV
jgi:hypothetical protein